MLGKQGEGEVNVWHQTRGTRPSIPGVRVAQVGHSYTTLGDSRITLIMENVRYPHPMISMT